MACLVLCGVVWRMCCWTQAEEAAAPVADRGAQAREWAAGGDLPTAVQRDLLYFYARLNKPREAEGLAERILAQYPADKQTLLLMASMYVERKDPENAMRIARMLVDHYPRDHQALYFFGAAHYLAGRFDESARIFRELKEKQFEGKLYSYQTDWASAELKAGQWYQAQRAYQELLQEHQLSEELRLQARAVLERIYREHLPQLWAESSMILLDPGRTIRSGMRHERHVTERQRLSVRVSRVDTEVLEQGGLRRRSEANHDGVVGWETVWAEGWQTRMSAGGSDTGMMGGVGASHWLGEGKGVRLDAQFNQRAFDSLLLESLGGRQHRLSLSGQYAIDSRWSVAAELHGRQVSLEGETIGWGGGATWSVERVLLRSKPELRLGYRGTWMRFSSDRADENWIEDAVDPGLSGASRLAIASNLVLDEFHRQGIYAAWRGQWSGALEWRVMGGTDYAFDLGSMEFHGMGGVSFYPRKSIECRGEVGYASSASTGDQGSDQWQFTVALGYWF